MKAKNIVTVFIIFISFSTLDAKPFNCTDEYEWVTKTFRKNDAGYEYSLELRSKEKLQALELSLKEKITPTTSPTECVSSIKEWLRFFRRAHWTLEYQGPSFLNKEITVKESIKIPLDRNIKIDLDEFEDYVDALEKPSFEGIWEDEPYTIGVKKIGSDFIGFIIDSTSPNWPKGQIKFTIYGDGSVDYYMANHSLVSSKKAHLLGNNALWLGVNTFYRDEPSFDDTEVAELYFEALSSRYPFFRKLDSNTGYLRIRSFDGKYRKSLKRLLKKHAKTIGSQSNLIIDIRNNGGGSDSTYKPLLPLLYTDPIRTTGVEFLSTELNNQRMLDFIKESKYGFNKEEKKWAKESYDKLSKNLGSFIALNDEPISVYERDSISEFPKNISIISNQNVASTAEQFLLAAKQSKKVKIYGKNSAGILDISNMYFIDSPSGHMRFGYSLSKSLRLPEQKLDGVGVEPDHEFDHTVNPSLWIEIVKDIMSREKES